MARQYVITEQEIQALLNSLELSSLRRQNEHVTNASIHKQDIDDVWRMFHLRVCRWANDVGFTEYHHR
jgi:CBS-domain-containing membrane protein